MGTKEQYDHQQEIQQRAIRAKLNPAQRTLTEPEPIVKHAIEIDDYCRKCGQVTKHELYARSVRHSGNSECQVCGHTERA